MSAKPTVSIIIPCLNESASIALCVQAARSWLERSGTNGEIIVVDNGSTDGTAKVAAEAGAAVIAEPKRGKGNAMRAGVAASSGRLIVMSDGDGTYDLSDLDLIVAPLDLGFDLVIGNRFRGQIEPGAMPWHHKYIGNPFFNTLITVVSRRSFGDCLSGLRSFTRDTWQAMALTSNGFELESEMCLRADDLDLGVANVPIFYRARRSPSHLSSVRHGVKIAWFIIARKRGALAAALTIVGAMAATLALLTRGRR
jgi:glycosyltransferase involved in cell wall biosynthesis